MRNRKSTCGRCGKTTYENVHPEFPECSHGCAEWVCDRTREERHFGRDSWGYEDNGGFW